MAFSLFKKKNYADTVVTAAKIYTLDDEYPEASAIAVKDGIILAVGSAEDMESYKGPSTETVDLSGKYAVPGFISLGGNCAETVTKGIINVEEKTAEEQEEAPEEIPEEAEVEESTEDAEEDPGAAEPSEEDLRIMYEYNEAISERQKKLQKGFNSKGFTSVLSIETDRRSDIYKDSLMEMYQDGSLSMRYFGSFALTKQADPRILQSYLESCRVACMELGSMINFGNLDILNSSSGEEPNYMTEEYLRACCKLIASHGFCIRFTPSDRQAALTDLDIAGELSETYGKQSFVVQHDMEFSQEDLSAVFSGSAVVYDTESRAWKGAAAEINKLTIEAAHAIGKSRLLGSIENGKAADLAVFDSDPFAAESKEVFDALSASCIIISGKIITL